MGDSAVNIQVNALTGDTGAQLAATGDAVAELVSKVQLSGGDLRIFESILRDDAKAGIALTDSLESLAGASAQVGRAVADAAAAALAMGAGETKVAVQTGELGSVFDALAASIEVETAASRQAASGFNSLGGVLDAFSYQLADTAAIAVATGSAIVVAEAEVAASFEKTMLISKETALGIREAMFEAGESVLEFAERAKFAHLGVASAFSGMAGLLGAGIMVSMMAEMLNHYKEHELHLAHLSEATGIEVKTLVELKGAMENVGTPAEMVDRAMVRLSMRMRQAANDSPQAIKLFNEVGIATKEWGDQLPHADEVLLQIADHLSKSEDAARDMGSASRLLGGNVVNLIGFLKQGSEAIKEQMQALEYLGRADSDAVASTKELQREEANLGHQFHALVSDVFPGVVVAFKLIDSAGRLLWLTLEGISAVIIATAQSVFHALGSIGNAINDLVTGRLKQAWVDLGAGGEAIKNDWVNNYKAMQHEVESTAKALESLWGKEKEAPKSPMEPLPDESKDKKGKRDKLDMEIIDGQMKHQKALYDLEKEGVNERAKLNKYEADVRIALLQSIEDRELNAMKNFIERKIAIARNDPDSAAEIQKLLNERQALEDHAVAERQKNTALIAEDARKRADALIAAQIKTDKALQEGEVKQMETDSKHLATKLAHQLDQSRRTAEALETQAVTHQTRMFEISKVEVDEEFKLGKISADAHLAQLRRLTDEEFNEQLKAETRKLALVTKGMTDLAAVRSKLDAQLKGPVGQTGAFENPAEVAKILGQIESLYDKHNLKLVQDSRAAALHIQSVYKTAFDPIISAFDTAAKGIIQGTQTVSQAMARMGQNIVVSWASTMIQVALKHAESIAIRELQELGFNKILVALHLIDAKTAAATEGEKTAAAVTGAAARAAAETAAATTTAVEGGATRFAEVMGLAAVAAAGAFAATAAIPIVGPELAPAVAAATYGEVAALAPLAAFERGGISEGGLAFLHPREMVLPEGISSMIQGMASDSASGGGSTRPSVSLTYNAAANESPDSIRRNKTALYGLIQEGVRLGHLKLA